jgi:hypothetical protein
VAKTSGLGAGLYVGGYDVSGDTQSATIAGGVAPIDVTAINASAYERIGGVRDGSLEWVSYFNTTGAHVPLSALPRTDVRVTYRNGSTIGDPAASLVAKQINYDGSRAQDGAFTFALSSQANAYGLTWGQQLTAGLRTDTAATNGASIDTTASASFGWSAYLHVTAVTGTDVTMTIQDSADNAAWANLSGGAFTAITAIGSERIAAATSTATVRRYVRVITTTSGGLTSVSFVVNFAKNESVAVTY